jgi:hypothetical protein
MKKIRNQCYIFSSYDSFEVFMLSLLWFRFEIIQCSRALNMIASSSCSSFVMLLLVGTDCRCCDVVTVCVKLLRLPICHSVSNREHSFHYVS